MSLRSHASLIAIAASLALGIATTGCEKPADDAATMDTTAAASGADVVATSNANVPDDATVRSFMDEAFNKGNTNAIDQFIAADYVDNTPGPGQEPGIAGFKKMIAGMRTSMPDMKLEVTEILRSGDLVAMHTRQTGTHTTSMMGEKPTGNKFDLRGMDLVRFVNGKAVEHWGYYEEMKMMQQLGMMPAPPAGATGAPSTTPPLDTAKQ